MHHRALIAITLAACAVDPAAAPAPPTEIRWAWGGVGYDCADLTTAHRWAMGYAEWLWGQVGAEVTETSRTEAEVLVCLVTGEPQRGRGGAAHELPDGRWLVELDATRAAQDLACLATHELGHVILPGSMEEDHLEPGEVGIMSPTCDGIAWSPADRDHLAAWGFSGPSR